MAGDDLPLGSHGVPFEMRAAVGLAPHLSPHVADPASSLLSPRGGTLRWTGLLLHGAALLQSQGGEQTDGTNNSAPGTKKCGRHFCGDPDSAVPQALFASYYIWTLHACLTRCGLVDFFPPARSDEIGYHPIRVSLKKTRPRMDWGTNVQETNDTMESDVQTPLLHGSYTKNWKKKHRGGRCGATWMAPNARAPQLFRPNHHVQKDEAPLKGGLKVGC